MFSFVKRFMEVFLRYVLGIYDFVSFDIFFIVSLVLEVCIVELYKLVFFRVFYFFKVLILCY